MYAMQGILMTVMMPLCCDITALVKVSVAENRVPPIVNVFNTSQPLWFYQRNSTDPIPRDTCISYGFIDINETDYYSWNNVSYTQTFNISERCHGKFEDCTGGNLGAIEITCRDETDYISGPHDWMELMYTEPNCSVFFTYSLDGIRASTDQCGGVARARRTCFCSKAQDQEDYKENVGRHDDASCQMFITGSAVRGGPTQNCTDYFNKTCKGYTAVFYNPRCS